MRRFDYRAALTDAVARFQADVRRLGLAILRHEHDRLLATLQSTPQGAGTRAAPAPARQTRKQSAATGTHAEPVAAAGPRTEPAAAGPHVEPLTAAAQRTRRRRKKRAPRQQRRQERAPRQRRAAAGMRTESAAAVARAELAAAAGPHTEPATTAVDKELPGTAGAPVEPAAAVQQDLPGTAGTPAEPAPSAATGRKRVRWTRETIINELAGWMSSGTVIDLPFVKRHGPPGLVAATLRIFGRFDAALNVAGLHVAKLYPDGPPTR